MGGSGSPASFASIKAAQVEGRQSVQTASLACLYLYLYMIHFSGIREADKAAYTLPHCDFVYTTSLEENDMGSRAGHLEAAAEQRD